MNRKKTIIIIIIILYISFAVLAADYITNSKWIRDFVVCGDASDGCSKANMLSDLFII